MQNIKTILDHVRAIEKITFRLNLKNDHQPVLIIKFHQLLPEDTKQNWYRTYSSRIYNTSIFFYDSLTTVTTQDKLQLKKQLKACKTLQDFANLVYTPNPQHVTADQKMNYYFL
jgi:hypothetical protein